MKSIHSYQQFLLFIFLISAWNAYAQQKAIMTFEDPDHYFGGVREDSGSVQHKFLFINTGSAPLKIEDVKASCGCTTPAWSSSEVLPADTGYVTVEYNPFNRPGPFSKTITVTSNATPNIDVLTIEGHVLPRLNTIEEEFPYKAGDLRFKHKILNMGKVTTQGAVAKEFPVYNEGKDTVVFADTIVGPSHIRMIFAPKILAPGERGEMILTYDPTINDELGFSSNNIVVFTNEKEKPEKQFSVYATVEEYFPPLKEDELSVAPKIAFDKTFHDFGEIDQGKVVEAEFEYTNNGEKDLKIRKVMAPCSCVTVALEEKTLKQGGKAKLKVSFDTTGMWGTQQKTIVLFTNDPRDPIRVLTLKGRVEDYKG